MCADVMMGSLLVVKYRHCCWAALPGSVVVTTSVGLRLVIFLPHLIVSRAASAITEYIQSNRFADKCSRNPNPARIDNIGMYSEIIS